MPFHFRWSGSPLSQKGEGVVIGGPTVNTQAQQAEQANQNQAQQYAAQQQQQALAGISNWTAQNKPPGQTAAPVQAPQASSPATMGGGSFGPSAQVAAKGTPRPPMPQPAGTAQPGNSVALNPAQKAHIMALFGGQGH